MRGGVPFGGMRGHFGGRKIVRRLLIGALVVAEIKIHAGVSLPLISG